MKDHPYRPPRYDDASDGGARVEAVEMDNRRLVTNADDLRAQLAEAKGAIKAQDNRERAAGDKCGVSFNEHGCDWPDTIADTVIHLRTQLAEAQGDCASLRSALEIVGSQNHNLECPHCSVCEAVDKALALNSGQALLTELQTLRAERERLDFLLQAASSPVLTKPVGQYVVEQFPATMMKTIQEGWELVGRIRADKASQQMKDDMNLEIVKLRAQLQQWKDVAGEARLVLLRLAQSGSVPVEVMQALAKLAELKGQK